ncbi:MAG: GPW/gp25 family protein [Actinomycetes bacterium]|jgi:hypothetical protein
MMTGQFIQNDFTGSGFDFPMGVNPQGGMRMVTGAENVERSIRLIIGTAYGERPMRPEFGCGIHDLVFEPSSVTLAARMALSIKTSLARWETRADIVDVSVTFDPADTSLINILVTYSLKGSYSPRNLLVPFYRIPTEE